MKIKLIDGKRYWEKEVIQFYEEDFMQEFTLVGKHEIFSQINDGIEYPDDDYGFQMQIGNQIIESENIPDEMVRKGKWGEMVIKGERDKDVKFVLFYNPCEFLAYVKDEKALQGYGGQFSHNTRWEKLGI